MPVSEKGIKYLSIRMKVEDHERIKRAAEHDRRAVSDWARIAMLEAVSKAERQDRSHQI